MNHESVRAPHRCPDCAARQQILHALTLVSDGVRASSSFHCTRCGSAFEADDRGVPPELRPLFLEENGHWELRVLDAGPGKVALLQKLRELLTLDLAAVGALSRRIPGAVADGTWVEMAFLLRELQSSGAVLEVAAYRDSGRA